MERKKISKNKTCSQRAGFPDFDELRWTFEHCPTELLNDRGNGPVLTQVRLLPYRKWNKLWELELSFYQNEFSSNGFSLGRTYKGFLACHARGDFLAYSVRLADEILWFDTPELALSAFLQIENVPGALTPSFNLECAPCVYSEVA